MDPTTENTTAAQMAEDDAFNPALISGGDHPAVDQPDEGDIVQSPLAFLDADEVTE